ncbi:ATP-binding protein, partial [Marivita cryptomonadis]
MLTHPTHDALRALKLDGMAEVLAELLAREDSRQMDPIEWIGLMLDRESATRDTRRFQTRLRAAKLRDSTACLEDVDYTFPRKLDRALFQSLRDSVWISKARPILITGPCGVGKSWL